MKGSLYSQPRASLVRRVSSSPSGSPCEAALFALFGLPKPMIVRQMTSEGRLLSLFASMSAFSTAAGANPSTGPTVCHPRERNLAATSSVKECSVLP